MEWEVKRTERGLGNVNYVQASLVAFKNFLYYFYFIF